MPACEVKRSLQLSWGTFGLPSLRSLLNCVVPRGAARQSELESVTAQHEQEVCERNDGIKLQVLVSGKLPYLLRLCADTLL
eukprot:1197186-Amphidinium_carterae.1